MKLTIVLFLIGITVTMLVTTVVTTVVTIVDTIPFLVYGDSYLDQVKKNYEQSQLSNWSLGNNITEGDYYKYKICNDSIISQIIYPHHCYEISLEFVVQLESYQGKVWVVQGNFTIPDTIDYTILYSTLGTIDDTSESMIFLIDTDTFTVYSRFHKELGVSLENTIFSLSTYGVQSLSIGTIWDEIDSYFTNKIPLEIKNKQTIQIPQKIKLVGVNGIVHPSIVTSIVTNIETSVLSYNIIVPSNVYLHESFPFPLKAKLYSPNIIYPHPKELYYFELLDYSRVDSNYNSNHDSNQYSREFENFSENNTIQEELGVK